MHRTSLADIEKILRDYRLPREPVVIVHSSLFLLGLVEKGVKGVYDCLLETLGPDATVVMPSFTFTFGQTRFWSHRDTPSESGALTEYARKRPDAIRTMHPMHSVTAIGKHRDLFARCDSLSSFGANSPFALLQELDAFNLSVGTDLIGGATYMHSAEEELQVPYRFYKKFPAKILGPSGEEDPRTFTMYCRIIEEKYEYQCAWEPIFEELVGQGFFDRKLPPHGCGQFYLSRIRPTLGYFRKMILRNPFICAKAVPR